MRISGWSSDVCSSDLGEVRGLCVRNRRHLSAHLLRRGQRVSDRAGGDPPAQPAARPRVRRDRRRLIWEAAPARSPTRPPNEIILWVAGWGSGPRSEEHTSELQSLMRSSYAVFCLKK